MTVKLPTEHHLEFLSLTGGCTGLSESTLLKIPHCRKSHVMAQIVSALKQENLILLHANNNCADQPEHPHILISTFVQSELPRPILRNSIESDHGCTSRIYFNKAGDNMTLMLYNMRLTSQKPC